MNIELVNLTSTNCDERRIKNVANYSLGQLGIHPDAELSISLVDEPEMSSLHLQWMDEPGPTDVLSFPMDELRPNSITDGQSTDGQSTGGESSSAPRVLGDIVLCPSFAQEQARVAGHSLQEELELLTVHGVLHLVGFDHREPEEERVMFGMQEEYLKGWRKLS